MKASSFEQVKKFQDIPNIGPAMVQDFRTLGIKNPAELARKDGLALYKKLCTLTATRHDPCVLDTFMAAVDFMQGAPARPWWYYTGIRKKKYPNV